MSVEWMSLPQIQSIVTESVDFGEMTDEKWREMMKCKAKSPGFGYLLEDMRDNGFDAHYPIPIVNGCIHEGHHRLTAAILLCLNSVPVSPVWVKQYWPDNCGGYLPGERKGYSIYL